MRSKNFQLFSVKAHLKISVLATTTIFACVGALVANETPGTLDDPAKRVIVVANSADPDSLEIAEHYMRRRGVPAENLIAFPMPRSETISWQKFADEVHKPLLEELTARGLVDGTLTDEKDFAGRTLLKLPENFNGAEAAGTRISFLITCRGVPLRISEDKSLLPPQVTNEDGTPKKRGPLETNCSAVDSELALLAIPNVPVNGVAQNPFFKKSLGNEKLERIKPLFLKVARIDAPTPIQAKMLVENAIKAEENGLMGRAYIDGGGPYAEADKWIMSAGETAKSLGFDSTIDEKKALFTAASRYDAPAIYFGWYTAHVAGFFLDENFSFPPGAIAIHIHSFSATSMRSENLWTPGLVARGATATVGNVYEPFLGFSHRLDFFMEALADGQCAGDAAAFANPTLSWQTIFIGDPLYKPFKKGLEEQLADSSDHPSRLHQYAYLRAANLAETSGGDVDKILFTGSVRAPGLALNLERFRREFAKTSKLPTWELVPRNLEEENPGLLVDTAKTLYECGNPDAAIKIFCVLLDKNLVPKDARRTVLKTAIDIAKKSFSADVPLYNWEREFNGINTSPGADPINKD